MQIVKDKRNVLVIVGREADPPVPGRRPAAARPRAPASPCWSRRRRYGGPDAPSTGPTRCCGAEHADRRRSAPPALEVRSSDRRSRTPTSPPPLATCCTRARSTTSSSSIDPEMAIATRPGLVTA